MKDSVYRCPACKDVRTHRSNLGLVCENCHIFMEQVIDDGAFEDIDPDTEGVENG